MILKKPKILEWRVSLLLFVLGNKKLSSHMPQISKHINSSSHKIHSYDQISKMVVNLGSKKCKNNSTRTCLLTHLHHSLLMIIIDTPETFLSNIDRKYDIIKVRTSSVKVSSTLFSCSMRAMYNIFNCALKQRLMLKSYLTGINTSIFPKIHGDNTFSEN